MACACAYQGMIAGMGTGLACPCIANAIVGFAGGSKILTLFFTMLASLFLGMGPLTTANFLSSPAQHHGGSTLLAGVTPMAAYMFVFYFGIAADLSLLGLSGAYVPVPVSLDPIR